MGLIFVLVVYLRSLSSEQSAIESKYERAFVCVDGIFGKGLILLTLQTNVIGSDVTE